MGNIGEDPREVEFEPLPDVAVPEPAPTKVPEKTPEKVPA
jgi:hypothetical protein